MIDGDNELEFMDTLFLRAPLYSFENYALRRMPEILAQNTFRNALWLASPTLYDAIGKKHFDWNQLEQNEQLSLYKYYNRMSFRPTPFGAFASFCLTGWNDRDRVKLCAENEAVLHLLPSRQWLEQYQIGQQQTAADYLLRTNPTLTQVGRHYRLVKSVSSPSGKFKFHINEIRSEKLTAYLAARCANSPVLKMEILENIAKATNCSAEEGALFLDFLLTEQVLLTEYQGRLVAPGYWEDDKLLPTVTYSMPLGEKLKVPILAACLPGSDLHKNRFYGGLERYTEDGGVAKTVAVELLAAVRLLRRLVIPYPTPALKDFKKAFKQKFENQRVPLLKALDPDTGISYAALFASPEAEGLLGDIQFPPSGATFPQLDWTAVHRLLLRIWVRNPNRSFYDPVIISDEDAARLETPPDDAKLPPSLPLIFSRWQDKVVLDNLGAATALSLLGRFSVFCPEIAEFCKTIAAEEQAANPGIIFAEVHQLSDTHVDNVNQRVPLYTHVIDINTYPLACPSQQELPLSDLAISIHGGELWLESITLGSRVIPRLPTAYNFRHNNLAIFQMLCDLQFEGLQANLTFDLEKLFPGLDFYPRVVYGNVVICHARWKISADEISQLTAMPISLGKLHQLRQDRGIPVQLTMGLSDQQLNFNLINDDEALVFLGCLKENKVVIVREYLPSGRQVSANGKAHSGQFVAVLKNPASVYCALPCTKPIRAAAVQRQFLPGSEWLYVKIYCTPESADRVLVRLIAPFLEANVSFITQWFFIRYQDPEPHIRLRVRSRAEKSGSLLSTLTQTLARRQAAGLIRDVKCETYEREIERYSPDLIKFVEAYFCAGSDWALVNLKTAGGGNHTKLLLLIYRLAMEFLEEHAETARFFKWRSESFLAEFGGDKKLKISMDIKYRKLTRELKQSLATPIADNSITRKLLGSLTTIAKAAANWSPERRYILLGDLLHMQVNRFFHASQRQHEALICYCLAKHALSAVKIAENAEAAGWR